MACLLPYLSLQCVSVCSLTAQGNIGYIKTGLQFIWYLLEALEQSVTVVILAYKYSLQLILIINKHEPIYLILIMVYFAEFYCKLYSPPGLALLHAGCINL